MQRVRRQPDGSVTEAGAPLQEPDLLRPTFRRRGPHGELRLHATVTQLQAAVARLRRGSPQKQHDAHLPSAASGLLR